MVEVASLRGHHIQGRVRGLGLVARQRRRGRSWCGPERRGALPRRVQPAHAAGAPPLGGQVLGHVGEALGGRARGRGLGRRRGRRRRLAQVLGPRLAARRHGRRAAGALLPRPPARPCLLAPGQRRRAVVVARRGVRVPERQRHDGQPQRRPIPEAAVRRVGRQRRPVHLLLEEGLRGAVRRSRWSRRGKLVRRELGKSL